MQARSKIAQRGRDIGLDFGGEVAALRGEADWDAELAEVRDEALQYPGYYTQPFHAYAQGNLCWEAALQVRKTFSLQACLIVLQVSLCLGVAKPLHAERRRNGWQVNAAAKSVHAPVMDPTGKALRTDGDEQLRRSYSEHMARHMQHAGCRPVRQAVDLGCATGDEKHAPA